MGLGEKEKQRQKEDVAQGQDTASTGGHRVCSHPLGFVFLGDRTEDGAPDLSLQEEGAIFREETRSPEAAFSRKTERTSKRREGFQGASSGPSYKDTFRSRASLSPHC